MFCQKCGHQLEEMALFCTKCGEKTTVTHEQANPESSFESTIGTNDLSASPKKKSKKPILICMVVFILVAAVAIGLYFVFLHTSPSHEIIENIESGNFEAAVAIYDENFANTTENTANIENAVEEKLAVIQQDYTNKLIDYATATTQINAILRFSNENIRQKANTILDTIEALNASRIAFDTAQQFAELMNYPAAIENYKLVIDSDSNFETAQQEIINMIKAYKQEVLSKAQKYIDNSDYMSAVTVLSEAQEITGNDADITQKISVYKEQYVLKTIEQADAHTAEQDYLEAVLLLTETKKTVHDTRLDDKIKDNETLYIESVIAQADALLADAKYDEAKTLLNNSLQNVTDKTKLTEKLNSVDSYRPVSLSTVHLIDSNFYEKKDGVFVDSFGNTYNGYHLLESIGFATHYGIYNLNKEYTSLQGNIVACQSTGSKEKMIIQIYVDDVIKYTSDQFGKATGSINFNIDVSGAQKLKIEAKLVSGYWADADCALVNCVLTKDPAAVKVEPLTETNNN